MPGRLIPRDTTRIDAVLVSLATDTLAPQLLDRDPLDREKAQRTMVRTVKHKRPSWGGRRDLGYCRQSAREPRFIKLMAGYEQADENEKP